MVQQAILAEEGRWAEPVAPRPPWLATVCYNRDLFRDTAIMVAETGELYKFVYATQNPAFAAFARMTEVIDAERMIPSASGTEPDWLHSVTTQYLHTYEVEMTAFLHAHELGCDDPQGLLVVAGVFFAKGGQLVTNEEPYP